MLGRFATKITLIAHLILGQTHIEICRSSDECLNPMQVQQLTAQLSMKDFAGEYFDSWCILHILYLLLII